MKDYETMLTQELFTIWLHAECKWESRSIITAAHLILISSTKSCKSRQAWNKGMHHYLSTVHFQIMKQKLKQKCDMKL